MYKYITYPRLHMDQDHVQLPNRIGIQLTAQAKLESKEASLLWIQYKMSTKIKDWQLPLDGPRRQVETTGNFWAQQDTTAVPVAWVWV